MGDEVVAIFLVGLVIVLVLAAYLGRDRNPNPPAGPTDETAKLPPVVDWGPHGGPGQVRVSSGQARRDGRDRAGEGFSSQVRFPRTFADDLEEAVSRYGETVVFDLFQAQITIKCQQHVRGLMEARHHNGRFVFDDRTCILAGLAYKPGAGREPPSRGRQRR